MSGENRPRKRIAVLLVGQSARWARAPCSPLGFGAQNISTHSHVELFSRLEQVFEVELDLFLSTNDCSSGRLDWGAWLNSSTTYGPWLARVAFSSCEKFKCRRCLRHEGLQLLSGRYESSIYERVLISRPDLIIKFPEGGSMIADMINSTAITFPFKCEEGEFKSHGFVADTFMVVPGSLLKAVTSACFGRVGCFPDAYGNKYRDSNWTFKFHL